MSDIERSEIDIVAEGRSLSLWILRQPWLNDDREEAIVTALCDLVERLQAREAEASAWVYFVLLDGVYAEKYYTPEKAEHARLHESGHVAVENRVIWRERTVTEDVYPQVRRQQ